MTNIIIKLKQYKLHIFAVNSLLLLTMLASAAIQAQAPHGYERLALHSPGNIQTGVFEKKLSSFIYDHYANKLKLVSTPSNDVNVTDKRLIDIEVHVSGGAEPKASFSGVWVENDGYFQQDSWLTLGFSSSDITAIANSLHKWSIIPLDIEKYYVNDGQMSYAVIWQYNRHKVDWEVKFEASADDILRKTAEGYRLVDFDQFRKHYGEGKYLGDGQWQYAADSQQYFEAILVENSGNNSLDAEWKTISANPLDITLLNTEPSFEPEVFVQWPPPWAPDFTQAPKNYAVKYEGFNIFDAEKIVDVEFVEFTFGDSVFPETWALVITHPVPECRSKITEGVLVFADGLVGYDAEHDVGQIIDYEGTAPFQNKPDNNKPWLFGHTPWFYGPPGYGPSPTYIHGCKH